MTTKERPKEATVVVIVSGPKECIQCHEGIAVTTTGLCGVCDALITIKAS